MSDENVWERTEVLRRFCAVGNEVQRHLGYAHAADCFCGGNPDSVLERGGAFRYSEDVLAFVENAVHEAVRARPTEQETR